MVPNAKKIGISLDNPDITDEDIQVPDNILKQEIDGGRYAVFTHKGSYDKFIETYHGIFGSWLPENGAELREARGFEIYLNDPGSVAETELLTMIYIPII